MIKSITADPVLIKQIFFGMITIHADNGSFKLMAVLKNGDKRNINQEIQHWAIFYYLVLCPIISLYFEIGLTGR